jgi:hypothetical protein
LLPWPTVTGLSAVAHGGGRIVFDKFQNGCINLQIRIKNKKSRRGVPANLSQHPSLVRRTPSAHHLQTAMSRNRQSRWHPAAATAVITVLARATLLAPIHTEHRRRRRRRQPMSTTDTIDVVCVGHDHHPPTPAETSTIADSC